MEYHLRNEQRIAHHRNKEDYESQPTDCLQFAYGDRRYVKMTDQIGNQEDVLKIKNLQEINEDFHRADFITQALLTSDIIHYIIGHLSNQHDQIRELSSSAIVLISAVKLGRDNIITYNYIPQIMKLLDDKLQSIRQNGYLSLLNFTQFQEGIDHVFDQRLLQVVVDKLVEETVEDLLILALKLLERVLHCGDAQASVLKTPAIQRLTSLLERKNKYLRSFAAKNLSCISFDAGGKLDIIKQGVVLELCKRLKDEDDEVIINSTIALASLAQHNEGKFIMMDNNQLELVQSLLDHHDDQIKLNIVQLITSLAEHPKGRKECKKCLQILYQYQDDPRFDYISPYATQAIQVILWEP